MSGSLTVDKIRYVNQFLGLDLPLDMGGGKPPPAEGGAGPAESAAAAPDGLSGGFFDSVKSFAGSVADTVGDAASSVGNAVVSAGEAVGDAVVTAAETVGDAVVTAGEAVGDAVVTAGEVIGDTVIDVVDGVKEGVETAASEVAEAAKGVGQAIGDAYQAVKTAVTGKAPLPPDVPQARADERLMKFAPEDQAKVQAALDGAKSDQERKYITKALAAGHTAQELEDFAKKINGKDETWLNDNLRLVGDSHGRGIEQQWSYSCGPTTVEAIKGELDPLYAMKVREENPDFQNADNADGAKMNPGIAADQRAMLEGGKGVATSRDDPEGKGQGLIFQDLLNKQSGDTGLVYDRAILGKDTTVEDALNTMSDGVKKGVPVPITVGDDKAPFAHAALVVAVDDGPPRSFTIHDPYYGKTDTFTEDQIKNDQVSVGGWHHVGVVFPPSIKK